MRIATFGGVIVLLVQAFPSAHAEARICNHFDAPTKLAIVWIKPSDAKEQNVPFTTQGWWRTQPGSCTDIDIDGVLMYFRVESDFSPTTMRLLWWPSSGQKVVVRAGGDFRYSRENPPSSDPSNREAPFEKFGAFPLYGKGHWLLLTLDVSSDGVKQTCKATTGGASLRTKC